MRNLLIGHRGAGKTALATRAASRGARVLDLDTVLPPFDAAAERDWRAREAAALDRALARPDLAVIAAGAGALTDAGSWSPADAAEALRARARYHGWRVLWVRRDSDPDPRHLARPALPGGDRRGAREDFYALAADSVLTLPEGLDRRRPGCPWEEAEADVISGVSPRAARSVIFPVTPWDGDAAEVERWGAYGELRDDLLSAQTLLTWSRILGERAVLSCRDPTRRAATEAAWREGGGFLDVPAEWGQPPSSPLAIRSFHVRGDSLAALLEEASAPSPGLVKVAVTVRSLVELEEGHAWAAADPDRRAFLPTSTDGGWTWYRLLFPGPLPFVRRGRGTAPDQPTLLEWLTTRRAKRGTAWAAVLGNVSCSRTPVEQAPFWAARGLPVLRVPLPRGDLLPALGFLRLLGLSAAAVASPLKTEAAWASGGGDGAVNTLVAKGDYWAGGCSDGPALREFLRGALVGQVIAVHGGGALLPAIREALPGATCAPARPGRREAADPALRESWESLRPDVVVWAGDGGSLPPGGWRPRLVVDLSYGPSTGAACWAADVGAERLDGLPFFLAQAEGQRAFWEAHWRPPAEAVV